MSKKQSGGLLAVSLGLVAIGTGVSIMTGSPDSSAHEEKVPAFSVSQSTAERLDDGTVLSFGGKSANSASIIVDPTKINESPLGTADRNEIVQAVKGGDMRLNVYFHSSGDSDGAVDSISRVSVCSYQKDKSPRKSDTLEKILDGAQSFKPSMNAKQASNAMNIDPRTKCAKNVGEASSASENNALHFMTQFQTETPTIFISNDKGVKDFNDVGTDWVSRTIHGEDAAQITGKDVEES